MKTMHIIDTSSAVHAGLVNTRCFIPAAVVNTAQGYRERVVPMGSVNQIFNCIAPYAGRDDVIFCCDREPTIKRGMYQNYSTSSHENHLADVCKEITEYVLNDCGFTVFAVDGYEADDLIYSCVRRYKREYDHVFVHSADSDTYVNISSSVTVLPTHSRAKTVTIDNYEFTVNAKKATPYNTILAERAALGDTNRGIICPKPDTSVDLLNFMRGVHDKSVFGDKKQARQIFSAISEDALLSFDLAYPLDTPTPEEIRRPTRERLSHWAFEMRSSRVNGTKGDLSACIAELLENGNYIE